MVEARGVDALQVRRAASSFSLCFGLLQLLSVNTQHLNYIPFIHFYILSLAPGDSYSQLKTNEAVGPAVSSPPAAPELSASSGRSGSAADRPAALKPRPPPPLQSDTDEEPSAALSESSPV